MKKLLLLLLTVFSLVHSYSQVTPTPDKLWGSLFKDVQVNRIFPDNKTFVDCTPKYKPEIILSKYAKQKNTSGFDLKSFVLQNFNVPVVPDVKVKEGLSIIDHLEDLWNVLTRKADKA